MTEQTHNRQATQRKGGGGSFGFGLLFIVVGGAFLARKMGVLPEYDLHLYWPSILIVVGLIKFLFPDGHSRINGLILMLLGGALQLHTLEIVFLEWDYVWPGLLILLGFWVMFPRRRRKPTRAPASVSAHVSVSAPARVSGKENTPEFIQGTVLMGAKSIQLSTGVFEGASVQSLMGSYEIDLSEALMAGPVAEIDARAIMGSVELRVPKHWRLRIEATPILGSIEDHTRQGPLDSDAPELIIRGEAIMGSVEIRN